MNKRYLIAALAIIGMGALYKRSLQTMDSEEPSPKRARLTTISQDNSDPVQQGATPSEAPLTNSETITFRTSDGEQIVFPRNEAMQLKFIRLVSKYENHPYFRPEASITLEHISSEELSALAPIINNLSTALNLDNLVIENLKSNNLNSLKKLIPAALFLDQELGHSIARLYIFKKLKNDPDLSFERTVSTLKFNHIFINDYQIVESSAGFKWSLLRLPNDDPAILYLACADITNLYGLSLIPNIDLIKELFLSDNQLTELPHGAFTGFSNLQEFYLDNNQLSQLPDDAFAGLIKLKKLYLNNNQLRQLPAHIFASLTRLRKLDLRHNQLTEFPADALRSITNLRTINLLGNPISLTAQQIKQQYFPANSRVQILM